ncbi:MAG: transcriptional regulator PpsR [Pseudomonadota bacterium]
MNTRSAHFWGDLPGPPIAAEHLNDIVTTAADLAIVLETSGKVRSVIVNPLNPTLGRLDHWKDRDIREFTAEDSLSKIEAQLQAYRSGHVGLPDAIEVNHFDNANWEFPIRYTLHRIGRDDVILMLGRDLRPIAELQHRLVKAQLALEKDYESHRDFETRYRVVMEATNDPLALVQVASGRIVDVNTAGARLLGAPADGLVGGAFTQEFEGRRRGEFIESLVAMAGNQSGGAIHAETKRDGQAVSISPTLFRAAGERMLLCVIEAEGTLEGLAAELATSLSQLYHDGPDAIVVTDVHGHIRAANEAFLGFSDAGQLSEVKGRSFGDFLSRGSVDLKVLIDTASRSGRMRVYSTRIDSAYGAQLSVEISATRLTGPGQGGFAFVLRDTSRMEVVREPASGPGAGVGPAPGMAISGDAARNVMDLVGSSPLKDIVAATTDVVEKMCIETAVELTGNNRVAAAEMLGLSRQSLYVKLRKHGLLHRNGS